MNRIRLLRQSKGMTQLQLSETMRVTQATLSNWERGIYDVDNKSLLILADFFGVSTDYLLGKSDEPNHRIDENADPDKNIVLVKGSGGHRDRIELSDAQFQEVVEYLEFLRFRGNEKD